MSLGNSDTAIASLNRIKRRMSELQDAEREGVDKAVDPRYVLRTQDILATWELIRCLWWDNQKGEVYEESKGYRG